MRGLGLFSLLGHFTDKTISWKNMILQNVCGLKASEKQKSWEQSRRRRLWFSFRLHHMIFLRTSSSAPLRLPANIIKKSLKCSENGHLRFHGNWANLICSETSRDVTESSETAQSGDAFSRHTSVASVAVLILFALHISDVMQFYCHLHLLPFAQNNKYTLVACVLD